MKSRVLGFGALLLLAGCGGVSETGAPMPELTPPPAPPPPPVSSIAATLSVPLAQLQKLINDKMPQQVADLRDAKLQCAIGDCLATLQASRSGPVTLSGRDGALLLGVPFAVDAMMTAPKPMSFLHVGVKAAGQLKASTALALGKDWEVRPNTGGTVQFSNGRFRLGALDGDFTQIWNANAGLLSRPLLSALDTQVAAGLVLKKPVAELWAGVFAPIKLGTTPASWLVLQPEQIRVGVPRVNGQVLSMGLGVDVRAQLVASETRPSVRPAPLPPPAEVNGPANHFSLRVPVLLPYDEAAKLGLAALQKNPPRAGSHSLKITGLRILPSGRDVVIAASFCIAENWDPVDVLSGCGSGYLRGVPEFDAASQTIRITHIRYDVLTANWMLSAMSGLAGDDLGKEMEKALQFKAGGQIARLKEQVSAALAKPQGDVVMVSGQVEKYGPVTLSWNKDGLVAFFSVEGSLTAQLRL